MDNPKTNFEIRNIKLELDEDESELIRKVADKLKLPVSGLRFKKILRKSIDARNKNKIQFIYNIEVETDGETKVKVGGDILNCERKELNILEKGHEKLKGELVVVGSGPAGMFAALELARNGYKPILIERGKAVQERDLDISSFLKGASLNPESNIQFGEGGAGTYSDGKLTTRIKDHRCDLVFNTFVKMGAPDEILYSHKPHIGTDILKKVVENIRKEIISLGGSVRFCSKLTNISVKDGVIDALEINNREKISVGALILAIGHSSRDTYELLYKNQVALEAKAFAIGLRIEHKQEMLNQMQYGKSAGHPKLGAADYKLAMRSEKTGRSAYSFCMCPGGYVVAAASEENHLVVNGMSEFGRDGENANSALVVNVNPEDFGTGSLAGIEFQRLWEKKAFELGGGAYYAPVEKVGNFLGNIKHTSTEVKSSYRPGVTWAKLENCLPEYVTLTLKEGLLEFDKKIKGFAYSGAILTGVETRTSAPVRILRNDNCQSVNTENLYPCGEGAGYAGGIVSAAVDGIRCAQAIISRFL